MAVLVEAISVIIRSDAILNRFQGGWEGFKACVPNATLCADGELVRVGFMHPDDVTAYVDELIEAGLGFIEDGNAQDVVVVDQMSGFMAPCDWAEIGKLNLDGNPDRRITACLAKGSKSRQVVTPDGWTFEDSLTASFGFVPLDHVNSNQKIEDADGLETWQSPLSDKPVYDGRTSNRKDSGQFSNWLSRVWKRR